MSRTPAGPSYAAAVRLDLLEGPDSVAALVGRLAERGGRVRTVATVRSLETDPPQAETYDPWPTDPAQATMRIRAYLQAQRDAPSVVTRERFGR